YLAAGVTTLRTTGSIEPYADLNLKQDIDAGKLVGPHLDVTGPYLEGATSPFIQMHHLTSPEEARQIVNYWADRGVTSFKAYINITRAELKAAIEAAHKHGIYVNTQLDPDKQPDVCPRTSGSVTLMKMAPDSAEARALIAKLVKQHV